MNQEQLGTRNFVQIGLFGGIFWGGIWYFLHIFRLRKQDRIISFYHLRLVVGRKGHGECVRNCLYGTSFNFNCLLYKICFAKFEGILPGMIYGLFWWALLFFGMGLLAPAIKSALNLPKETIVTTMCILYCMVCLLHTLFRTQ